MEIVSISVTLQEVRVIWTINVSRVKQRIMKVNAVD
jgi:hypothetical protein